jgi:hypothetical protein
VSAISGLVQVRRSNDTIGLSLRFPDPDEGSRPGPQLSFVIQACAGAKILKQVIIPEKLGRLARSSLEPAPI